jgi:hypothetical protein
MSLPIILAIDENKDTVRLYEAIENLVPPEKIKIALVFKGKDGLAFLQTQKPTVILLRYPIADFGEFVRYILSQAKLRWIPLVIVSGTPKKDTDFLISHFGLGHIELHQLPTVPLELIKSIQRAISEAKQRYLQDSKHSIFIQYSQTNINPEYLELQKLLANKSWSEADLETARLIFQVGANELDNDLLDNSSISKRLEALSSISLEDLQTIDYLWVIYSNGHFGFSIQWEIFQQILNELANNLKVGATQEQLPDPEMDIDEYAYEVAKTFMGRLPTEFFQEKYPITGRWTAMTALTIALGWLSKGGSEWSFDCKTNYSLDVPKGHLPTSGKQAFGFAFHHGFMLHHIFSKLYP